MCGNEIMNSDQGENAAGSDTRIELAGVWTELTGKDGNLIPNETQPCENIHK
jgi:hypothetical protein